MLLVAMLLGGLRLAINPALAADPAPTQAKPWVGLGNSHLPPFRFLNAQGRLTGLAVDASREALARTGQQARFQAVDDREAAIRMLAQQQADFILVLTEPHPQHPRLAFSQPIFTSQAVIFVASQRYNIHDKTDLTGKHVLCVALAVNQWLAQNQTFTCQEEISPITALYRLAQGEVDAVVAPMYAGQYLIQELELAHKVKMVGPPVIPLEWSVAVSKDNPQLLALLNQGLEALRQDGTLERLHEKYLGRQFLPGYTKKELWLFISMAVALMILLTGSIGLLLLNRNTRRHTTRMKKTIERLVDARRQLARSNRALRVLSQAMQPITGDITERGLMEHICRVAVEEAGYRLAWVGYVLHDPAKSIFVLAQAGYEAGYVEKLHLTWADAPRGRGPSGTSARENRTVVCQNILTDPNFALWREDALKRGYRASIAVPLRDEHGQPYCLLTIYASEPDAFGPKEMALLEQLALELTNGLNLIRSQEAAHIAMEEITMLNTQLETRVAQRTEALQQANQELEAFSYTVSHDLRAPLRHVIGLSQAVLEDYREKLDTNGQKMLDQLAQAGHEMTALVEGLLVLSRVGRGPLSRQPVDISHLCHDILVHLQNTHPDHHPQWEVAEGLLAQGDPVLLRTMLQNLLGNAWKYTKLNPAAQIVVGQEVDDADKKFYIQDNGVGFDMAYANKLFLPFSRLHPAHTFEGTGIGLATVQRIVQRHGGKIWAQASPGVGATFYFTLPINQDKDIP